jgi:hypothetical protein
VDDYALYLKEQQGLRPGAIRNARKGCMRFLASLKMGHRLGHRLQPAAITPNSILQFIVGTGQKARARLVAKDPRRQHDRGVIHGDQTATVQVAQEPTEHGANARERLPVIVFPLRHRLLSQLRLAGVLDAVAGVVVGNFSAKNAGEAQEIQRVLREYFGSMKVPVVMNFPVGHISQNATLPHGALVELDADKGTFRVLQDPVQIK